MESKIICNSSFKKELLNLCGFDLNQKFKLLYRGSLHGFSSSQFHAKCDNISKTLTVVKSKNSGYIFGGYTEATWDPPDLLKRYVFTSCAKKDKNAFIFSLVNEENTPVKVNIADGDKTAIIGNCKYGPIFGKEIKNDGVDIGINLDNYKGKDSYSHIGGSYILPKYAHGSKEAKCFLAGSKWFQVDEIEVFQLLG